jgi:hypothetical protein
MSTYPSAHIIMENEITRRPDDKATSLDTIRIHDLFFQERKPIWLDDLIGSWNSKEHQSC